MLRRKPPIDIKAIACPPTHPDRDYDPETAAVCQTALTDMRTRHGQDHLRRPGFIDGLCHVVGCGAAIAISPAAVKMLIKDRDVQTLCWPCAVSLCDTTEHVEYAYLPELGQ